MNKKPVALVGTLFIALLLMGRYTSFPVANAQNTNPTAVDVGNAIYQAQDFLNRLERYDPGCTGTNGNCAFLSEYPNTMPIYIQYAPGCSAAPGWRSNGEPANQESVQDSIANGYSSTISVGVTSEEYSFSFDCYSIGCGCTFINSPLIYVTDTYYGYQGLGPTFQFSVTIYLKAFGTGQANIYDGDQLVASNVGPGNVGQSWTIYPVIQTPAFDNENSLGPGFNFGQYGAVNDVGGLVQASSFRYTQRSGGESAYKWISQSSLSDNGISTGALQGDYWEVGVQHGWNTGLDVYAPTYFTFQQYDPENYEYQTGSGSIYQDCYTSLPAGVDSNGIGWYEPYNSKVCASPGTYVDTVEGQDPLVVGNIAVEDSIRLGPTANSLMWSDNGGACQTISPLQLMTDLTKDGWIVSDSSTDGYVVVYPSVNIYLGNPCNGGGFLITPGNSYASGPRTAIIAELATLLAYKYGYSQFDSYAGGLINALLDAEWGTPQITAPHHTYVGDGYIATGSNSANEAFRPQFTGGEVVGWNLNYNPCSSFGNYCVAAANPQTSILDSWLNMPAEYLGYIPANQETTQVALAALETYYQYVSDPYGGGSGLNDGIQPFFHWIMDGTWKTQQVHTFDIYGLWPNGNMYANIVLDDEGDGYQRCMNIYLDANLIANCITVGPYNPGSFNEFTVSLGSLAAGYHTIGIYVTTADYTTPHDYWMMSMAVDDPPVSAPPGTLIVPQGMKACTSVPSSLAEAEQMNQAGAFENCVNPIGNLALNGTGFVIQTSP